MHFTSEVYPLGQIRYFRQGSILQEEGKRTLKAHFQSYHGSQTLDQYFASPAIKSKLKAALHSGILRQEQYSLLFPVSGSSDIDEYDITLLSLLIRCLHPTIKSKDPVWTNPPPGDMSIEADVTRIRDMKNQIWSHPGNMDVSDNDFKSTCQRLEMILTRMARKIGNPILQPSDISEAIRKKMTTPLQQKPENAEIATNTSNSLGRDQEKIAKEMATSTTDLNSDTVNMTLGVSTTSDVNNSLEAATDTSDCPDKENDLDINNSLEIATNTSDCPDGENDLDLNNSLETATSTSDSLANEHDLYINNSVESRTSGCTDREGNVYINNNLEMANSSSDSLDREIDLDIKHNLETATGTPDCPSRENDLDINNILKMTTRSCDRPSRDIENIPEKKNTSTSTSTLDRKRKLSYRMKSALEPFILRPKNRNTCLNLSIPRKAKPQKRQTKLGHVKQCSCGLGSSRFSRVSSFHANDHTALPHRCCFSGIEHLSNGFSIVLDSTHNLVQVLNENNELFDELEYPHPRGVCALPHNTVAITLSQDSKVVFLKIDHTGVVPYASVIDIGCKKGWLLDIKFLNNALYVLCDSGEIHVYDLYHKTLEQIRFAKKMKACFFDISRDSGRLFLSNEDGVVCINQSGETLWRYRGKGRIARVKTTGVLVHKGSILVSAWEDNKVIEISQTTGNWIRDIGVENLQNPWALAYSNGQLYVTQYMADLDKQMCMDIITFKS